MCFVAIVGNSIPYSEEQNPVIYKLNIIKLFAVYINFLKKYLDHFHYEFTPLLFIEALLHVRFCAGLIST